MAIKLIASDMDGTLLLNGARTISPNTIKLIHRLKQKGISFLAASGRQYASLQRLFSPIKREIGYLCENGCLAFYQGEMIFQETMPRELGQEIMHAIDAKEGCEIMLSGVNTCYLQPKDMEFYYYVRDKIKNNVTVVPDIFAVNEPYMKISMYQKSGVTDKEMWQGTFGDDLTVVTSGAAWMDVMPKNVNKGTAITRILEYLDIAPDECFAFGDNYNDVEMLEAVGYPVFMKNGVPDLKEHFQFHTESVEHVLEYILHTEEMKG